MSPIILMAHAHFGVYAKHNNVQILLMKLIYWGNQYLLIIQNYHPHMNSTQTKQIENYFCMHIRHSTKAPSINYEILMHLGEWIK